MREVGGGERLLISYVLSFPPCGAASRVREDVNGCEGEEGGESVPGDGWNG